LIAMTGITAAPGELELDGVFNFRDLGGLCTGTGGVTAFGRLFRADGLHRSPPADRTRVGDIGITQVVDLRTDAEIEREGRFELAGVEWYHTPILQSLQDFAAAGRPSDPIDLLCHHFEHMVETNLGPLVEAIGQVAEAAERGPVVFHCTAGKDRTGVVAALILAGIGVTGEDIARDFARSADGVRRMVEWYRQTTGEAPVDRMAEAGIDPAMADIILSAKAATMDAFLARLAAANGDVASYLQTIGAADAVARIGRILLDT
jgi:protein-tyrosine phosphatase